MRHFSPTLFLCLSALLSTAAQAGTLSFNMDTSALPGSFSPGSTETAVFQLTSITPGTTTVSLTNITPAATPPSLQVTDVDFYNEGSFEFVMGNLLAFTAQFNVLTVDPDPTPDLFGLYLMDNAMGILGTTDDISAILLFALNLDSVTAPTLDIYSAFDTQGGLVTPLVQFSAGNAAVPEPSAAAMFLIGGGMLLAACRRKRHNEK